jgi:PIN domain nuclease of toxin-antitoxin system
VGDLPLLHRVTFDRMLITQAKIERFTIVTRDSFFREYKASRNWAGSITQKAQY